MRVLKTVAENILAAAVIVRKGGLIVYPTETVYGLGCDPFNVKAVRRLLAVKGPRSKPLPILASDVKHIEKIVRLSKEAKQVAAKFWPGALTLVLPKKKGLPGIVTSNLDSVGVRVPMHNVAIQLVHLCNGLLIGTSANKTGSRPPELAKEAAIQIGEEVDIILDGGPTTLRVSSTVVDLTSEVPKILRKGPISLNEILGAF